MHCDPVLGIHVSIVPQLWTTRTMRCLCGMTEVPNPLEEQRLRDLERQRAEECERMMAL